MLNKKNLPFPDINLPVMVLSSPVPAPPLLQLHFSPLPLPLNSPRSERQGAPPRPTSHASPRMSQIQVIRSPDNLADPNRVKLIIIIHAADSVYITSKRFSFGWPTYHHRCTWTLCVSNIDKESSLNPTALYLREDLKHSSQHWELKMQNDSHLFA